MRQPVLLIAVLVPVCGFAQEPKVDVELVSALRDPAAGTETKITAEDRKAFEPLSGHWIVRSVEVDGQKTPAQIGQQPDDIIRLEVGERPRLG